MKNLRKYAGETAPNPKEFGYWVDLSSDPHGKIIKTYTGESWEVIKTQSDGSGSESGGETSTVEYLDVRGVDANVVRLFSSFATSFRCEGDVTQGFFDTKKVILNAATILDFGQTAFLEISKSDIKYVCIAISEKMYVYPDMGFITIEDILTSNGYENGLDSIPRITKEEFYNIDQ